MSDHKAEFEVRLDPVKRILYTRMQGLFSEEDMQRWANDYRRETDRFAGGQHIVIADMRGMKTVHPNIAHIMGEAIGYARQHGVALCAHISDDTVQRLQAQRLARQNSAADDVTVEVDSPEEAERVVDEARSRLDDPNFPTSIRTPA